MKCSLASELPNSRTNWLAFAIGGQERRGVLGDVLMEMK